jgi:hypothetical protein
MYGLMGIIGCFVTLSLFWMEYGDLISLPEPFFTEYYTVIGFSLVCVFSAFLSVFMYNFLITTIGIIQRLKNPLSGERNA